MSTNLHVFAGRSRRPNTSMPTGRHQVIPHFTKYPNCEVCELTMTTQAPCQHRLKVRGDRARHPQRFGDAVTAGHEVLCEEKNVVCKHR